MNGALPHLLVYLVLRLLATVGVTPLMVVPGARSIEEQHPEAEPLEIGRDNEEADKEAIDAFLEDLLETD